MTALYRAKYDTETTPTTDEVNRSVSENETILEEAERLTNSKRKEEYGTYADNAKKAIDIYKAIRGKYAVETPADVALFQLAHKLGREMCRHKRDNVVDACGYLKLYYEEASK